MVNGTTYYYVVSALNPAGESANSAPASATPQAPPYLNITYTGMDLTLAWPAGSTGFMLQSCTNLAVGGWINVDAPAPQMIEGEWRVVLPVSENTPRTFYRLEK